MNLKDAYVDAIARVRRETDAVRATVADVVFRRAAPSLLSAVDDAVRAGVAQPTLRAGIRYGYEIARCLEGYGIQTRDRQSYCATSFGDTIQSPVVLLEVLAFGFDLDVGLWWRPGAVAEFCGTLETDRDGLTTGPAGRVSFAKEGVTVDKRFLVPYSDTLSRFSVDGSGGFLDMLTGEKVRAGKRHFGLLLGDDFVVDKERYPDTYITKAYIRGPRGLSVEMLRSPRFPESSAGTVTVHMRVDDDDPLSALRTPLIRTEIEWSIRDGQKTVKIEELVPPGEEGACTRFVHARWNAEKELFDHFDGAALVYDAATYAERLGVDLTRAQKTAKYIKVFRLDDVDCDLWSQLVARFFHDNELVTEYLGGTK